MVEEEHAGALTLSFRMLAVSLTSSLLIFAARSVDSEHDDFLRCNRLETFLREMYEPITKMLKLLIESLCTKGGSLSGNELAI